MGLDTSHGCWHGPYSQFMRWRTWLAKEAGVPLELMEGFYKWEWDADDLKFDRDYNRLTRDHDDYTRGVCWYDTLAGFKALGRAIPWNTSDPLAKLLHHSDCNGSIKWWNAKPIALRLTQIIRTATDDTKYPTYDEGPKAGQLIWSHWRDGRGCYDGMMPATKRFAVGLVAAYKAREHVRFA